MRKLRRYTLHIILFFLAALVTAALALALFHGGMRLRDRFFPAAAEVTPAPATLWVTTPPPAAALELEGQSAHPALMDTDGGGAFQPERAVTRRELCRLLYPMLDDLPEGTGTFSDLDADDPDYPCIAALCAAELLPARPDGSFGPEEELTRGELAYFLLHVAPSLPEDGGARAGALATEVLTGGTSRSGVAAGDGEPVAREELAVVLVRLAGREPDEAALFLGECLPADVGRDNYAWAYIADAVTAGLVPAPAPGVHRAYGWLYAVREDGTLMTDTDFGVWTFGVDGAYTTGDEDLDGELRAALEESGANELPDDEALEAAYLYVKYNFVYLVRPEDMTPTPVGATGWEYERALRFFRYGGGTCYGFAAAFGLMARALGQTAYVVAAEINEYHGAHSFVVIPDEDGEDLIYDVELEATRQSRHEDLALFGIKNYQIYNYWYVTYWAQP